MKKFIIITLLTLSFSVLACETTTTFIDGRIITCTRCGTVITCM